MEVMYFLTQVKRTNGTVTKGCAVHSTADDGRQAYFAYLSAYGFGHEAETDYVFVALHDSNGAVVEKPKVWEKATEPETTEE